MRYRTLEGQGSDFSKIFYQPVVPADARVCTLKARITAEKRSTTNDRTGQTGAGKGPKGPPNDHQRQPHRRHHAFGRSRPRYGNAGLPDDTIHVKLTGTAGRPSVPSGAWRDPDLTGEGNDYVGRGCRVVASSSNRMPISGRYPANIIVGNTVMYGATEGRILLRRVGGERFLRPQLRRYGGG